MFVNTPIYSLGEEISFTGEYVSEREPGFSYTYSESGSTVSQVYVYNASGSTDYREAFYYTSLDGEVVTDVSINSQGYERDSVGRTVKYTSASLYEKLEEDGSQYNTSYASATTYGYDNDTGFELEFAITESVNVYSDGTVETRRSEYEYTYKDTALSIDDWFQECRAETIDYGSDGIIDYTVYSLQEFVFNDYDNYYNEYTGIGFNSAGVQASSFTYLDRANTFVDASGYYQVTEQAGAYDYNEDGGVDFETEYYQYDEYDSLGSIVYYESSYITKQDYDYDGYADRVNITKSSGSQSGGKQIYLDFDNTVADRGPQLYITISKDTDGDFSYDTSRSINIGFEAPSALTRMGGHIASIEDTLLMA